jgi:two-component system response regulator NreC
MTISLLLVDDHTFFRKSVRSLLEATTDFRILGEAGNGMDALVLTEQLQPDVVVVDCAMPDMSGIDVAWWLCKRKHETSVVILSLNDDENYVLNALQNGASGYILKTDVVTHLALAVAAAAAKQFYFSPSLRDHIPLLELAQSV